mmetsp:Transcript_92995/g.248909  ORF Transcript_92995/g.248909 Transcript_92995/m.248909 type:complete len:214 (-) Transcript_92995:101-742(-)
MEYVDVDISELPDACSTVVRGMSVIGYIQKVQLRANGLEISKFEDRQMDIIFTGSQPPADLHSAVASWFSQVNVKTLNLKLAGTAWTKPPQPWSLLRCAEREPRPRGNQLLLLRIAESRNLQNLLIDLQDANCEDIAQRAVGQALQLFGAESQQLMRVEISTFCLSASRKVQAVLAAGLQNAVCSEGTYEIFDPNQAAIAFSIAVALERVGLR